MQKKRIKKSSSQYSLLIRQLKEIKQKIIMQQEKLLDGFDDYPIGICITDKNGNYIQVNETYARMYGYQKEELIGSSLATVLNQKEDPLDIYFENFNNDVEEKGIMSEESRKNGSTFPLIYISSNLYPTEGEVQRIFLAIDISDTEETDQQLHQTVQVLNNEIKTLNQILASRELAENIMLHDIKRPLKNIKGICQILKSGQISEEEKASWMQSIEQITDQGLEQVETMQGISRMERGVYEADFHQVDLMEQLNEMKVGLQNSLNSKNLQLDIQLSKTKEQNLKCCYLYADVPFLKLLLNNLIVNAIEASPDHETITVRISHTSTDHLFITIHNKGAVPKTIRKNFFDKYVSDGKARGTGLGTYIAKLIVQSMNGSIKMHTSEQKGTTIFIQIPYQACHSLAA